MKRKLLIADDEPSMRRMLARALDSEPYELISAVNGKEAMELAACEHPDLILLDIEMPEKNGLEVLRELREHTETRMTPVIMLTGHAGVEDEVGGLDLGADDYITKPFVIEELKARIASALRRHRMALTANPLTSLPGSPVVEDDVRRRIRQRTPFAFLYVDINHFKSYNDVYGFQRGDLVIRETAELLVRCAGADCRGAFVGHIGGDDFVVVCDPTEAPVLAQRIASEFDRKVPALYDPTDRTLGYVESKGRDGHPRRYPMVSLSIGIVTSEARSLDHFAKVVQIASEMKAYCKTFSPSQLSRFAFDRRSDRDCDTGRTRAQEAL